jgi:hypothetical protein
VEIKDIKKEILGIGRNYLLLKSTSNFLIFSSNFLAAFFHSLKSSFQKSFSSKKTIFKTINWFAIS